ncbi:radical SAM protein [Undibacterium sp. TS12]|uniref:radical SAM protein n=1 Tax=Undibacterium sp. TS12 TaxID=2908202 RepID=UPI001F4D02C8|nr:radical SAM protein [Undibacterium sp. TS12]MCH8618044.1 hypothetical protein [Undibacterium sp. TS12]
MATKSDHKNSPLIFEIDDVNGVYRFPVIQALNFSFEQIQKFDDQESPVPLFLELNLAAPCQMACQYCFTESATLLDRRKFKLRDVDLFALREKKITPLSVSEICDAMAQFSSMGGSVIFLCSEGEVLIRKKSCRQLALKAKELNLGLIIYTNMKVLDEEYATELHNLGVNLSCKLESLNPQINDQLIPGKTINHFYNYVNFSGVDIPEQLSMLLQVYEDDLSKLGLSTTLTNLNAPGILEVRKFAFEHGMQHMIKGLHFDGYANKNDILLKLDPNSLKKVESELEEFGSRYGYSCPRQDCAGEHQHAYDIRTWLNNRKSHSSGMFAKVITNQAGAFAEYKGNFVSVRDDQGIVNLSNMFKKLSQLGEHDI